MSTDATTGQLALRVLTPEGSVVEGDVFEVTLPGSEGELGVLPAHAGLLTMIVPGVLAYRAPGEQGSIVLGRGVAEVLDDRVTVLVDLAIPASSIDAGALQADRRRLVAERDAADITEERLAEIDETLALIEIQLRLAGGEGAH